MNLQQQQTFLSWFSTLKSESVLKNDSIQSQGWINICIEKFHRISLRLESFVKTRQWQNFLLFFILQKPEIFNSSSGVFVENFPGFSYENDFFFEHKLWFYNETINRHFHFWFSLQCTIFSLILQLWHFAVCGKFLKAFPHSKEKLLQYIFFSKFSSFTTHIQSRRKLS